MPDARQQRSDHPHQRRVPTPLKARARWKWQNIITNSEVLRYHELLGKRHICPLCKRARSFVFYNEHGHGEWMCVSCGKGDGFALIRAVKGWDYRRVSEEVEQILPQCMEQKPYPPRKIPHPTRTEIFNAENMAKEMGYERKATYDLRTPPKEVLSSADWQVRRGGDLSFDKFKAIEGSLQAACDIHLLSREYLFRAVPWNLQLHPAMRDNLEFFDLLDADKNSLSDLGLGALYHIWDDHQEFVDSGRASDEFLQPIWDHHDEHNLWMTEQEIAEYKEYVAA